VRFFFYSFLSRDRIAVWDCGLWDTHFHRCSVCLKRACELCSPGHLLPAQAQHLCGWDFRCPSGFFAWFPSYCVRCIKTSHYHLWCVTCSVSTHTIRREFDFLLIVLSNFAHIHWDYFIRARVCDFQKSYCYVVILFFSDNFFSLKSVLSAFSTAEQYPLVNICFWLEIYTYRSFRVLLATSFINLLVCFPVCKSLFLTGTFIRL